MQVKHVGEAKSFDELCAILTSMYCKYSIREKVPLY